MSIKTYYKTQMPSLGTADIILPQGRKNDIPDYFFTSEGRVELDFLLSPYGKNCFISDTDGFGSILDLSW